MEIITLSHIFLYVYSERQCRVRHFPACIWRKFYSNCLTVPYVHVCLNIGGPSRIKPITLAVDLHCLREKVIGWYI